MKLEYRAADDDRPRPASPSPQRQLVSGVIAVVGVAFLTSALMGYGRFEYLGGALFSSYALLLVGSFLFLPEHWSWRWVALGMTIAFVTGLGFCVLGVVSAFS